VYYRIPVQGVTLVWGGCIRVPLGPGMQEGPNWTLQPNGGALTVDRSVDRLTVDRSVDRLTVAFQPSGGPLAVDRSVDRWTVMLRLSGGPGAVDRWVDRLTVDRQTVDRSVDRLTVDRQTVERWVFNLQTPEGRQFGTGASCSRQRTPLTTFRRLPIPSS
jgi:hypothetical protein